MMNKLTYTVIAFAIVLAVAASFPLIMPLTDSTAFRGNYRIPYSMGYDYFLYGMYAKHVSSMDAVPVIGDSVIWGHYTDGDHTLSANLNRVYAKKRFMNMGLDGIHPAAMKGLVEMNSSYFKNRKIIAGINLLWMSSPRHDLTGPVNSETNHKLLLPQYGHLIPSYAPSFEERLSAVINRSVTFFLWTDHLKLNSFADKSFYLWTMQNPRRNIRDYFTRTKDKFNPPDSIAPEKMQEQNIAWVDTDKSLQWKYMLDTLVFLRINGCRVAAVVTPFNTYMMDEESRKKYFTILAEMEKALRSKGIIPVMPVKPGRKYFADSSHPTAEGYTLIVKDLVQNREFIKFLEE
jgi:hypothetical protein